MPESPSTSSPRDDAAKPQDSSPRRPPNRKGGAFVTRQNFSMHPDLMRTIFSAAQRLNQERTESIVDSRPRRVTYSKVVAAFAWLLKTRYLTRDGAPTQELRRLIADYEATAFEQPDGDIEGGHSDAEGQGPPSEREKFRLDSAAFGLPHTAYRRPFVLADRAVSAVGFDSTNAEKPLVVEDEASGQRFHISLNAFHAAPWVHKSPRRASKKAKGGTTHTEESADHPGENQT